MGIRNLLQEPEVIPPHYLFIIVKILNE